MKGKGIFMVRAVVADESERQAFDDWYEDEHLPDATRTFGASRAWRGWSRTDPSLHFAFYEFPDAAAADAIPGSPGLKDLIAEFDRVWGGRVSRSREVLEVVGQIES